MIHKILHGMCHSAYNTVVDRITDKLPFTLRLQYTGAAQNAQMLRSNRLFDFQGVVNPVHINGTVLEWYGVGPERSRPVLLVDREAAPWFGVRAYAPAGRCAGPDRRSSCR